MGKTHTTLFSSRIFGGKSLRRGSLEGRLCFNDMEEMFDYTPINEQNESAKNAEERVVTQEVNTQQGQAGVRQAAETGRPVPRTVPLNEAQNANLDPALLKKIQEYQTNGILEKMIPNLRKYYPQHASHFDSLVSGQNNHYDTTTRNAIQERAKQHINTVVTGNPLVGFTVPNNLRRSIEDSHTVIKVLSTVLSYLPPQVLKETGFIQNGVIDKALFTQTANTKHGLSEEYYQSAYHTIRNSGKLNSEVKEYFDRFFYADVDRDGKISTAYNKVVKHKLFGLIPIGKGKEYIDVTKNGGDKIRHGSKLVEEAKLYNNFGKMDDLGDTNDVEQQRVIDALKASGRLSHEAINKANSGDKDGDGLADGMEGFDFNPHQKRYTEAEQVHRGQENYARFAANNPAVDVATEYYRTAVNVPGENYVLEKSSAWQHLNPYCHNFLKQPEFAKWLCDNQALVEQGASLNVIAENGIIKKANLPEDKIEETVVNTVTTTHEGEWTDATTEKLISDLTEFKDEPDVKIDETSDGKTITVTYKDGTEVTTRVYEKGQEKEITTTTKTKKKITKTTYKGKNPKQRVKAFIGGSIDISKNTKLGYNVNVFNPQEASLTIKQLLGNGFDVSASTTGGVGIGKSIMHADGSFSRFGYNTNVLNNYLGKIPGVFSVQHLQKLASGYQIDAAGSLTEKGLASLRLVLEQDLQNPNSPTRRQFKAMYNQTLQDKGQLLKFWKESLGRPDLQSITPVQEQSAAYSLASGKFAKAVYGKIYGGGLSWNPRGFGVILKMITGFEVLREEISLPITAYTEMQDAYFKEASAGNLDDGVKLNEQLYRKDFCEGGICHPIDKRARDKMRQSGTTQSIVYIAGGGKVNIPANGTLPDTQFPKMQPLISDFTMATGNRAFVSWFGRSAGEALEKSNHLQKFVYNAQTNSYQFIGNMNKQDFESETRQQNINAVSEKQGKYIGDKDVWNGKYEDDRSKPIYKWSPDTTRWGKVGTDRIKIRDAGSEEIIKNIDPAIIQQTRNLRNTIVQKLRQKPELVQSIKNFETSQLRAYRTKDKAQFDIAVDKFEQELGIGNPNIDNFYVAQAIFRARMSLGKGNIEQRIRLGKTGKFANSVKTVFGQDTLNRLGTGKDSITINTENSFGIVNRFAMDGSPEEKKKDNSTDHIDQAAGLTLLRAERSEGFLTDPRTGKQIKCKIVTGLLAECNNCCIVAEPITEVSWKAEYAEVNKMDHIPVKGEEYITGYRQKKKYDKEAQYDKEYVTSRVSFDQAGYSKYVESFRTTSLELGVTIGMQTVEKSVETSYKKEVSKNIATETRNVTRTETETKDRTYTETRPDTPPGDDEPEPPKQPAPIAVTPNPNTVTHPGNSPTPATPTVQPPGTTQTATAPNTNTTPVQGPETPTVQQPVAPAQSQTPTQVTQTPPAQQPTNNATQLGTNTSGMNGVPNIQIPTTATNITTQLTPAVQQWAAQQYGGNIDGLNQALANNPNLADNLNSNYLQQAQAEQVQTPPNA